MKALANSALVAAFTDTWVGGSGNNFSTTANHLNFNDAGYGMQKRRQGGANGCPSWGDGFLMETLSRELTGEDTFR